MDYRRLGGSGLKVSRVVLGCARFGEIPDAQAARLVAAALDAGISTFDVADAYNGGRSEEVLGQAVLAHRDRTVICTKVGLRVGDDERGHTDTMLGRLD